MSILSIMVVLPIVVLCVMPQWHIVATDLWSSVILAGDEKQKTSYPWVLNIITPIITSAICVGVAHLLGFNAWLATGLCIMCVLTGMMGGLGVLFSKKDADCSLRIVILYFAVIFALIWIDVEVLARVGDLTISGWF